MTARTTYETTVKAASVTQIAVTGSSEMTRQEAVNQVGCNVAYNTTSGNYATFAAGVAAANAAKAAAANAAEVAKQAAVMVARDTLRATGDVGPA
jgi:hypothetical protein